jgi:hypothetical protein
MVLNVLSIVSGRPVDMRVPASEILTLHMSPKYQNDVFLENGSDGFDEITVTYEDHNSAK